MIRNIVFDFSGVIAGVNREKAVEAFISLDLEDVDVRVNGFGR